MIDDHYFLYIFRKNSTEKNFINQLFANSIKFMKNNRKTRGKSSSLYCKIVRITEKCTILIISYNFYIF
jgi:hypothetical protein